MARIRDVISGAGNSLIKGDWGCRGQSERMRLPTKLQLTFPRQTLFLLVCSSSSIMAAMSSNREKWTCPLFQKFLIVHELKCSGKKVELLVT